MMITARYVYEIAVRGRAGCSWVKIIIAARYNCSKRQGRLQLVAAAAASESKLACGGCRWSRERSVV